MHHSRLVCFALLASAAACGTSEDTVKREFAAVVADSNACERDRDCASINVGCPLGCQVAINQDSKETVQRRARELIEDYEAGGSSCHYRCRQQEPVACVDALCRVGRPEVRVDAGSLTDADVDAGR